MKQNTFSMQWIAKVSILSAIAFILMMFEVPLPISPSFYKLGIDGVASVLAGFAMGPLAGVCVEALKILLNVLFQGTDTAFVGELSNFIVGCALVLPSSLYYKHHKNKKGAMISLLLGTISIGVVGILDNMFIALPAYSYFYGLPMEVLIGMGSAIYSGVKDVFTFCIFMTLPFNIIKGAVVSLITMLIYKRVSPILHK